MGARNKEYPSHHMLGKNNPRVTDSSLETTPAKYKHIYGRAHKFNHIFSTVKTDAFGCVWKFGPGPLRFDAFGQPVRGMRLDLSPRSFSLCEAMRLDALGHLQR